MDCHAWCAPFERRRSDCAAPSPARSTRRGRGTRVLARPAAAIALVSGGRSARGGADDCRVGEARPRGSASAAWVAGSGAPSSCAAGCGYMGPTFYETASAHAGARQRGHSGGCSCRSRIEFAASGVLIHRARGHRYLAVISWDRSRQRRPLSLLVHWSNSRMARRPLSLLAQLTAAGSRGVAHTARCGRRWAARSW